MPNEYEWQEARSEQRPRRRREPFKPVHPVKRGHLDPESAGRPGTTLGRAEATRTELLTKPAAPPD